MSFVPISLLLAVAISSELFAGTSKSVASHYDSYVHWELFYHFSHVHILEITMRVQYV